MYKFFYFIIFTVLNVAYISKGKGTAVLSSSFERTSTGRELCQFLPNPHENLDWSKYIHIPVLYAVPFP